MSLILLDLDHTLIHSVDYSLVEKAINYKSGQKKATKKGNIHSNAISEKTKETYNNIIEALSKLEHYNMSQEYVVFIRPHAKKFISFIQQHYMVGIWTAACKSYAVNIAQHLDINPRYLLFDTHCNYSSRYKPLCNTKNIQLFKQLWMYNEKVTLIDDNEEVYKDQEDYVAKIKPFYYYDINDDSLLQIIESL